MTGLHCISNILLLAAVLSSCIILSLPANNSLYQNLGYSGAVVPNCSTTYQDYISLTSGTTNGTYTAVSYIADFIQGTVSILKLFMFAVAFWV